MNIITIDPSLTSTAVVVNDQKFVYTTVDNCRTKKLKLKGWFEKSEDLLTIREHLATPTHEVYQQEEADKYLHFKEIVSKIISDIKSVIGDSEDANVVAIEGYSFSSAAGPLIDLVTFGTLLRNALVSSLNLPKSKPFLIIPPTMLKLHAAKLSYEAIPKNRAGTLFEWRNHQGVAGGSFKKHDIYKSLTDNDKLGCEWVKFLRDNEEEVMSLKAVPKPLEDMNDAKIMYEVLKAGLITP
jgi:hypothetical protein